MSLEPNFALARRQLRRGRIEDALSLDSTVRSKVYRDQLLERLAIAADAENQTGTFEALDEDVIDTVVSIALSEVEEGVDEATVVVATCIEVLASDGQFARLWLLADRVRGIAESLGTSLLAQVLHAIADLMLGLPSRASDRLRDAVQSRTEGGNGAAAPLDEFVLAIAFGRSLSRGELESVNRATTLFLREGNARAFALSSAIEALLDATGRARPEAVLPQLDPVFSDDRFTNYLRELSVFVLYPAQINAISRGATQAGDAVVSLPTSSGKTLLAELRVAATLSRAGGGRAIYVAPYRLLARQVVRSFERNMGDLGLSVGELEGGYDTSGDGFNVLPDVVVCTPERFDAVLRVASGDDDDAAWASELLDSTKLLVFDEIQLVGRVGRGPRFELLLARARQAYPNWEFLGLAAATSDAGQLSDWLTQSPTITGGRRPTGTLEIVWRTNGRMGQRTRQGATAVGTLPRTNSPGVDAATLMRRLASGNLPALAVEPVRSYAESLAKRLAAGIAGAVWFESQTPLVKSLVEIVIDDVRSALGPEHPLIGFLQKGVAYHHAGLPTVVLEGIEDLARARAVRFVCATTTVAEGADLPFRSVVLPHLYFHRSPLDRGLYGNIVGRAGRANVSMEGLVFVLDSDAVTLRNYTMGSLWSDRPNPVESQLARISSTPRTADDRSRFGEVQSQLLAWLDSPSAYVENQGNELARLTLAGRSPGGADAASILFEDALANLEELGMVAAGSPYRLTDDGNRARLTGLNPSSVKQFEPSAQQAETWLSGLIGSVKMTPLTATRIAELLFRAEEVATHSLWMRSVNENERSAQLDGLALAHESGLLQRDIQILSLWLMGHSFSEIAEQVEPLGTAAVLFGRGSSVERTADACEYLSQISYASGWVWSSLRYLAPTAGPELPAFYRQCIEFGVPTETAGTLSDLTRIGRTSAIRLGELVPAWAEAEPWIRSAEVADLPVTIGDRNRIRAWQRRRD